MLTVAIQAGGQSSRMGQDKALKPFLGRPLIQRLIDRLSPVADEVIVTTNQPALYEALGLRLVSDIHPGRGALGGLQTALHAATSPYVAVVACDLPFASAALLDHAWNLMTQDEIDVVIPQSAQGLEPLHAVYRRLTCLPAIEASIAADQWKVVAWFPRVKVRILSPAECLPFDEHGLAFWNLNTPEEFAEAEGRARMLDRTE